MKTMPLQDLKDLFSDAIQGDLEQGVAWLNDQASERFAKGHPLLMHALDTLSNLDAVTSDQSEPVAYIDPDWKGPGQVYGKVTSPVTTYPTRGWLPLVYQSDPSEQVRAAAEREDAQENPLTKRGDACALGECGG
jgi:hypothetical protein